CAYSKARTTWSLPSGRTSAPASGSRSPRTAWTPSPRRPATISGFTSTSTARAPGRSAAPSRTATSRCHCCHGSARRCSPSAARAPSSTTAPTRSGSPSRCRWAHASGRRSLSPTRSRPRWVCRRCSATPSRSRVPTSPAAWRRRSCCCSRP
ncbi:MAG: Acyl dehydratase, partial [uncultured Nocardioidaceae bacterium]